MVIVIVLPTRVIAPACWLRRSQPDVTRVGVMVGERVMVGESVIVGVTVGVSVNTGVFVAVLVGVEDGVNVGVATVGVEVGEDGINVEGGTVTTMDTLTKTVRALSAFIGFGGVLSWERLIKGINLGTIGR